MTAAAHFLKSADLDLSFAPPAEQTMLLCAGASEIDQQGRELPLIKSFVCCTGCTKDFVAVVRLSALFAVNLSHIERGLLHCLSIPCVNCWL